MINELSAMNYKQKYEAAVKELRSRGIGKINLPNGEFINLVQEAEVLKYDDPIPAFFPKSVPEKWDNIEMNAVCYTDRDEPKLGVEMCDPEFADFWSVYLHDINGGVSCVADLQTREEADSLFDLLHKAAVNVDSEMKYLRPASKFQHYSDKSNGR